MDNLKYLEKRIRVVVPDHWSADEKGTFLENIVSALLRRARFRVCNRVRFKGMEIDVLAENVNTQERAFVECKFVNKPFSAEAANNSFVGELGRVGYI